MLAMCVRKPGDPAAGSSAVLQTHHHGPPPTATASSSVQIKTRKAKASLKVLKRSSKGDVERPVELSYQHAAPSSRLPPSSAASSTCSGRVVATTATKVRDDPEGHLIYSRGDRLDARCTDRGGLCVCVCVCACTRVLRAGGDMGGESVFTSRAADVELREFW